MSNFTKKLSTIAMREYSKYRFIRENQEPLMSRIPAYWAATGNKFPGVQEAWSAVFISWCVKEAGAGASDFKFSAAHAQFVYAAIRKPQESAGFVGRKIADYAPKVGDILHNNRAGNAYDFEFASNTRSYFSHAAIIIEVGADNAGAYLRTIGGNEGNSVGLHEVRLTPKGLVRNVGGLYISILECVL